MSCINTLVMHTDHHWYGVFELAAKISWTESGWFESVEHGWLFRAGMHGVSGLGILPEDNSDNYTAVVGPPDTHSKEIVFTVSNATLGYYWCEINNASSLPSACLWMQHCQHVQSTVCLLHITPPLENLNVQNKMQH